MREVTWPFTNSTNFCKMWLPDLFLARYTEATTSGLGDDGSHPSDPDAVIPHAMPVSLNDSRTTHPGFPYLTIYLLSIGYREEK